MRTVVTGGSGFVGTNLIEHLRSLDWEVLNLDIADPRNPAHATYHSRVDVLDSVALSKALHDFAPMAVVHLAARTDLRETKDLSAYDANTIGVNNLVRALRSTPSVKRAIFASTQLVCELGYKPRTDDDYCPTTLYGRSKAIGETTIRTAEEFGPTWTIVRPTSLWGPWFAEPYRDFFEMIAMGRYVHIGGESPRKQWGFVGNAAHALVKLLKAPAPRVSAKTFYLADYEATDLRSFAGLVQRALGARPIPTVPARAVKTAARIGDNLKRLGWAAPPLTTFRYRNLTTSESADLVPLEQVVGPLPYSIEEAVDLTVEWLRRHSHLASRVASRASSAIGSGAP